VVHHFITRISELALRFDQVGLATPFREISGIRLGDNTFQDVENATFKTYLQDPRE